ncbi:ArsR family transcriptional regulator [Pseudomonas aeruginosa]|nr:metalloregulator ArsR/SmtB family transcription factor [Pseudomonas aeruginosa]KZM09923.1 ArsR family transcriptional regulator [Pseudomonas aeruginosa]
MTSRKTTSADTAQCSTTSHDAATEPCMHCSRIFNRDWSPSRRKVSARTATSLCDIARASVAVGDIAEALDLSQSLVSHHLRLLRGARLVRGERQAKHIFYSIADQHVSQVLQDMAVHISEDKADD